MGRLRSLLGGLVFPVVVALAALFGINTFRATADEHRQGQILLARVDAAANRQGVIVSNVSGLGIVVREDRNPIFERDLQALPTKIEEIGDQIAADMTSLSRISAAEHELRNVESSLDMYQSVVERQVDLLTARAFDEAWIFGRERVEPAYDALHLSIRAADTAYSELANTSDLKARWATTAIVGFVVLVLLAFQYEINRRQRVVQNAEQRVLKDNEARFRSLVQNSADVISITADDLTAHYHSPSIERLLGIAAEDAVGKKFTEFACEEDGLLLEHVRNEVLETPGGMRSVECRLRGPSGATRDVEITVSNQLDVPNVRGLVFNARDITERKDSERERQALEEQLAHQAFHDPLTGLANRVLFKDRVDHSLARRSRTGEDVALLFLDLDNFKSVNDSFGHDAGDSLLINVAERLQACLRDADTIARLGGDEFAVLLENVGGVDDVYVVADRLIEALQMPFKLNHRHVMCTASIGIAFSDSTQEAPDELLANADVAMYAAKAQGKSHRETYRPDMRRLLMDRMDLEVRLQQALENREFIVHYQPIVAVVSGHITGVEALVRWQHPEKGILAPGDFIPLAEETGLIVPIGRWVLEQACYQARTWQVQFPSDPPLKVSVNLSVRQFQKPNIVAEIASVLQASELPPASLILEITESMLVQDTAAAVRKLEQLKSLGVQIALDDFGTGYSSLSYLRRFPIDVLKIDKSFIEGVHTACEDSTLTRAIVQIGETLSLRTVAEGIELAEQAAELHSLGCNEGQGYYFARPLEADALADLLGEAAEPLRAASAG